MVNEERTLGHIFRTIDEDMAEIPITRGADDFVAHAQVVSRTEMLAKALTTMSYGEYMLCMLAFADGDEQLQIVLAKRLWVWAVEKTAKPG